MKVILRMVASLNGIIARMHNEEDFIHPHPGGVVQVWCSTSFISET